MKKILFILLSFCLAGEMEVDGDLKVIGTVDANGNPITNVGAALSMTDAINGNVLQSALRDDGVYEYAIYFIIYYDAFLYGNASGTCSWQRSDEQGHNNTDWTEEMASLSSQGWEVHKVQIHELYMTNDSDHHSRQTWILKRKVSEDQE
jgi:hypothetical protein